MRIVSKYSLTRHVHKFRSLSELEKVEDSGLPRHAQSGYPRKQFGFFPTHYLHFEGCQINELM
mgnify:FL=1